MRLIFVVVLFFVSTSSYCQSWYPVDSGFTGYGGAVWYDDGVNALCSDTSHNRLWAAGKFITSGSDTINNIGWYDGFIWHPMQFVVSGGDTLNYGGVTKITTCQMFNNKLIFATDKSVSYNRWRLVEVDEDSISYRVIGTFNSDINAMCIYHDSLYVAGDFTNYKRYDPPYNLTQLAGIAKWNGTDFVDVGGGMSGTAINDLCVYNDRLVAGGLFEYAGGVYCKNVSAWDGAQWSPIGNGLGSQWDYSVDVRSVCSYKGKLFAGGLFNSELISGVDTDLAFWDGNNWNPAIGGPFVYVSCMDSIAEKLYVGVGNCYGVGFPNSLVYYNDTTWFSTGNGTTQQTNAIEQFRDTLYIGGVFNYMYNHPGEYYGYVGRFDPTLIPAIYNNLSSQICKGNSYDFNGQFLTESGIYNDTVTAYSGGDSIIILNLTVNLSSNNSINHSICEGDTYYFNGNYLTLSGTYLDTLNNLNTCDSLVTLILTVININPLITSNGDTLIANGNGNVQWYDCDHHQYIIGATNNIYIASSLGNYKAIFSNGNCSDSTDCFYSEGDGINELKIANCRLQLYPNPVSEKLTINSKQSAEKILIMDITGRKVFQTNTNTTDIDVSSLTSGMYLLRVEFKNGDIAVGKFVKD